MIKLILLTGFLGTGKTTLLKQLLSEFKDEKIGVIINEFGQINIDVYKRQGSKHQLQQEFPVEPCESLYIHQSLYGSS